MTPLKKKIFFKELAIIVLLIAIVAGYFNKYLTGENLFFATDEAASDLLDFYYPQRAFLADHLKNNQIPLWNPYEQSGFPFLAEAQTGIFYPVNLVLFKFLPTPVAFNWTIISAYLILSVGTYLFLKNMGLSGLSAFLGANIITFSGFFMGHLKHVPLIQAAAFLPWTLFFTDKLINKLNYKYFVFLALSFALCILPGHLPTSYSVILITVIYFLLRAHQSYKNKDDSLRPIILFFLAIATGFMICAIQLLPTAEMVPLSTRNVPVSNASDQSMPFNQLITFLEPYHFGNPSRGFYVEGRPSFWEVVGYIGLVPLFLFAGVIFTKNKSLTTFRILLILNFIIVLGFPANFFQSIWAFIPGLIFTRIPTRYMLFVDFFLAVIASFGLEKIYYKKYFETKILAYILVLLTLADLYNVFCTYNGYAKTQDWLEFPKSLELVKNDPTHSRITIFGQSYSYPIIKDLAAGWSGDNQIFVKARATLPPTLNSLFSIPSIHFQYEYTGSFTLSRNTQLSALIQGTGIYAKNAPVLLGLQNVKYILTMIPAPKELTANFKVIAENSLIKDAPDFSILENRSVMPRAYLVKNAVVASPENVLAELTAPGFNPKSQVVLEKESPLPEGKPMNIKSVVKLIDETDIYLKYQIKTPTSSYFVLSDSYYPGWKAKIDGTETEILRANYAYRAIVIPSGEHTVDFVFQPESYSLGRLITFLTIGGLGIFVLVSFLKNRR